MKVNSELRKEWFQLLILGIITAVLAAAIGLVLKFVLQAVKSQNILGDTRRITWPEWITVMVLLTGLVVPIVTMVGNNLSVAAALTQREFWNSTQKKPSYYVTTCDAGTSGDDEEAGQSNCDYEYDTGQSYSWTTEEDCYTDSNNVRHCTEVSHSADIYAPYVQQELHYYTSDWLGDRYEYSTAYVGPHPVPYDSSVAIPASLPHGPPASWVNALNHWNAGDPLPVTQVRSYNNPILATHDQDYLAWSNKVDYYRLRGLLPPHTENLFTQPVSGGPQPSANKVMFVKVPVADKAAWEQGDSWLNAALGMKLQGDLHVVVINSALVDSPRNYLMALKAYWQSERYFGKFPISKNAVILVIGTRDFRTVDWAQATTGMPFGNGVMLQAMSTNLAGQPLNPATIFGHPSTHISETKSGDTNVSVTLSNPPGILENILLSQFPFHRYCMICKGTNNVGYGYLVQRIQPPLHDKVFIVVIAEVVALALWGVVALTDIPGAVYEMRTGNDRPGRQKKSPYTGYPDYRRW